MKANVKPVEQGKEKQSLELLENKAVLNISIVSRIMNLSVTERAKLN